MSPKRSQASAPNRTTTPHPRPFSRVRQRGGITALIAAPLVLAATIGWSLSHDDTPRPSQPHRSTALHATLPLYGLLNSPPETARQVHRAEQSLIATCMARHGFRYDRAPASAPAAAEAAGTVKSYFGIESVGPEVTSEQQPVERSRGADFARALYGDPARKISARNKAIRVTHPATGCLAEAESRLLGKNGRQRNLTLRLVLDQGERDAVDTLADDPALHAADADWRTCMAGSGIKAPNPHDFAQHLPRATDLTTDRSVTADLTCKKRTHYLERAYGRLGVMQQTWLTRHQEQAAAWKALRTHEAREARQVLADHGGPPMTPG